MPRAWNWNPAGKTTFALYCASLFTERVHDGGSSAHGWKWSNSVSACQRANDVDEPSKASLEPFYLAVRGILVFL